MLQSFKNIRYVAILPWKQGEVKALDTISRASQDQLCPLFVVQPGSDYDHETRKTISLDQRLERFGTTLRKNWGKRLALVDGHLLDSVQPTEDVVRHPMNEILERARLAGAFVGPVARLDASEEYKAAVQRFLERNSESPACIRLTIADLESRTLAVELIGLITSLRVKPERTVLVVDLGALDVGAEDALELLVRLKINALPYVHQWMALVLSATSFPPDARTPASNWRGFVRYEARLYRRLAANGFDGLVRPILYGDYSIEYPRYEAQSTRRSAVAKLWYSTPNGMILVKGRRVLKGDHSVIAPVAALLRGRPEYMGPGYSEGDTFIAALAEGSRKFGNPSKWRWAGHDHHLTLVATELEALFRTVEHAKPTADEDLEQELFKP